MTLRFMAGVLFVGASFLACATTEAPAGADESELQRNEISVAASEESTDELGVVTWRTRTEKSGMTTRGLGKANETRVEIRTTWESSKKAIASSNHVRMGGEEADLDLTIKPVNEDDAEIVVDDGLTPSKKPLMRALTLAGEDLAKGDARSSSGAPASSVSLGAKSLQPATQQPARLVFHECPTALSCKDAVLGCGKAPVSIFNQCISPLNPGKAGVKTGRRILKKVGSILFGEVKENATGKDDSKFDPIDDCVQATQELKNCPKVEPQCNPIGKSFCEQAADECKKKCSSGPGPDCNHVGPDGKPGTPDDAPSCASTQDAVNRCMAKCGG